jgi:PAS domain S-box-containing protein
VEFTIRRASDDNPGVMLGRDQQQDGAREGAGELARLLGGYAELLEQLPVVVYVAELSDRARLRYVSPQVEELLGYPASDWLGDGSHFADRIHPDDRARVLKVLSQSIVSEEASAGEFRMVARDGHTVWLADRRMATYGGAGRVVVGMLTEVTARKAAEEELARSRHLSAAVLESLTEGLLVLDRAGRIVMANRNGAELVGVPLGELTESRVGQRVV